MGPWFPEFFNIRKVYQKVLLFHGVLNVILIECKNVIISWPLQANSSYYVQACSFTYITQAFSFMVMVMSRVRSDKAIRFSPFQVFSCCVSLSKSGKYAWATVKTQVNLALNDVQKTGCQHNLQEQPAINLLEQKSAVKQNKWKLNTIIDEHAASFCPLARLVTGWCCAYWTLLSVPIPRRCPPAVTVLNSHPTSSSPAHTAAPPAQPLTATFDAKALRRSINSRRCLFITLSLTEVVYHGDLSFTLTPCSHTCAIECRSAVGVSEGSRANEKAPQAANDVSLNDRAKWK